MTMSGSLQLLLRQHWGRIFIDKSLVEVFVNGKQALSVSVRPGRDDSMGVSIRSKGQEAELISLDAWKMKNINFE
jgi:beta-fructofuranosidase